PCAVNALPAEALAMAGPPSPAAIAILPSRPETTPANLFRLADQRIEPARGPPRSRPSLVTLKIRLQN
ncbi:MAG: hypothetical protein KJ961_16300, partial [Alphaproteobacteria bacterium]|nr:hypothetical protein [Alphaproteobacteria bacterium]